MPAKRMRTASGYATAWKKEMGEQLTDREIDDIVAAGNIGIAVGIVTTDIVLVKGIA